MLPRKKKKDPVKRKKPPWEEKKNPWEGKSLREKEKKRTYYFLFIFPVVTHPTWILFHPRDKKTVITCMQENRLDWLIIYSLFHKRFPKKRYQERNGTTTSHLVPHRSTTTLALRCSTSQSIWVMLLATKYDRSCCSLTFLRHFYASLCAHDERLWRTTGTNEWVENKRASLTAGFSWIKLKQGSET